MYRADLVIAGAQDLHPRYREVHLPPDLVCRQFNDAHAWALRELVPANPEAFHEFEVIPNDEVTDDPNIVDLTRAGLVDWQTIDAIDYRTSSTGKYCDQVALMPLEARHRVDYEFEHLGTPRGFLYAAQRTLQKVKGWDTVWDLRVSGLKVPTQVAPESTDVAYPFPGGVGEVVKFRLALMLAPQVKMPVPERNELERWQTQALESAHREVKMRVTQGAQFEDIPFFGE